MDDEMLTLGMLKDEYLMLQEFYQDIDRRCFTIMGWSITVAMTAIGAAVVYGKPILLLVACLSALIFWYLEATWRGLSYFMSQRILQIEQALQEGRGGQMVPLQLYSEWRREFKQSGSQTRRYLFKSVTPMPHVLIALFSLALYAAVQLGLIQLFPVGF